MTHAAPTLRNGVLPTERRPLHDVVIVAALAAITANVFLTPPLGSANDRSRWCTVQSLLSGHGYVIDEIDRDPAWRSIDKVRHEGHFYSTKPPLLPTLVAGITWVVETVGGLTLREDTPDVVPWVLLVVNVLPLGVTLFVLARFVEHRAGTPFAATFVIVTAAMGTLLVPFSSTLNNHTLAACSAALAVVAAARIRLDDDRRPWLFVACGFLAGFTCTNELPAASFGVAVFLLLALHDARRTWAFFVPAAVVPLGLYLGLNVAVTGGLKPFYAAYGTEKYVYVFEGVPSYWARPTGIDRSNESFPVYFFHCVLGHHGILSLSPVFLLTLAGWGLLIRGPIGGTAEPATDATAAAADSGEDEPRTSGRLDVFGWLGLALTVVVLGFYMTRTKNYNYGGMTAGLRWTIWLIPFWLIGMLPALDRTTKPAGRVLAVLLLAGSVFSAWSSARTPWEPPWLYDVMARQGWIDYSDPPPELERPLHSLIAALPDRNDDGRPRWAEFESSDAEGVVERVRFVDHGPAEGADGDADTHEVEVVLTRGTVSASLGRHPVSAAALRGESPPDWPTVTGTAGDGNADIESWLGFVRGLPMDGRFRPKALRYVRTPLRIDAFECIHAMSRVTGWGDGDEPPRFAYCETWLSDEVPFGVVQFVKTVTEVGTGDVLGQRVWKLVDASNVPPESAIVVTPSR